MKKFLAIYFFIWTCLFAGLFLVFPEVFNKAFVEYFATGIKWKTVVAVTGALILGLGIEWYFVGFQKSALNKLKNPTASTKRDIITCLLNVYGVFPAIGFFVLLGLPFFSGKFIAEHWQFNLFQYIPSDFLKGVAALTLLSFFEYWGHRWSHHVRPLWEVHKFHHSATEMSVFAAHRNNPFGGPILSIITTIPFVFFGATLGSLWWVGAIRMVHDYIIHSEIDQDWGWIGRWVIVSPRAHRAHHSDQKKYFECNFGFFIIFWDRVFGTFTHDKVDTFGVYEPVYNNSSIVKEMLWPLYKIFNKNTSPIAPEKPKLDKSA